MKYAVAAKRRKPGEKYLRVYVDRRGRFQTFKHRHHHGHLTREEVKRCRSWAKRTGRALRVVAIDPYPWVIGDRDGLHPQLLRRLNRVGKRLGKTVRIRSGRRTRAEQQALWNQNMNPDGTRKPGRPLTARPGTSNHEDGDGDGHGEAADCEIAGRDIGDYPGAIAAMDAEGLGLPVEDEDWHVEITNSFIGARS